MAYEYETSCVDCPPPNAGEDLLAMIDRARDVSYRTMLKHCPTLREWAREKGYGPMNQGGFGLFLQNDPCVSFAKSVFRGKPCYFVTWSAIEFIWTWR